MLALAVCCFAEVLQKFCRSLPVGMENEEWTALVSIAAQVSVEFHDVLPGSVHAGHRYEFFLAKLLGQTALSPYFK